jgi:hypothetical protein
MEQVWIGILDVGISSEELEIETRRWKILAAHEMESARGTVKSRGALLLAGWEATREATPGRGAATTRKSGGGKTKNRMPERRSPSAQAGKRTGFNTSLAADRKPVSRKPEWERIEAQTQQERENFGRQKWELWVARIGATQKRTQRQDQNKNRQLERENKREPSLAARSARKTRPANEIWARWRWRPGALLPSMKRNRSATERELQNQEIENGICGRKTKTGFGIRALTGARATRENKSEERAGAQI